MLITDLATPSPCYGLQQALHQVWWGIPSMHNTNPVSSKIPFLPPGSIKTQYFLTNQKMRNCGPDRPALESSRGQLLRSLESRKSDCARPPRLLWAGKGGRGGEQCWLGACIPGLTQQLVPWPPPSCLFDSQQLPIIKVM